jgi:hypothetical protein
MTMVGKEPHQRRAELYLSRSGLGLDVQTCWLQRDGRGTPHRCAEAERTGDEETQETVCLLRTIVGFQAARRAVRVLGMG